MVRTHSVNYAHAVWFDPRLTSGAAIESDKQRDNVTDVYLHDLPAASVSVLSDAQDVQSRIKHEVKVHGVKSPHGLFTHPHENGPATVVYQIERKYGELTGAVAINDSVKPRSKTPMIFLILGDGNQLWKSQPLQEKGDFEAFRVDVSKVDSLNLLVQSQSAEFAHAVWIEPRLTIRSEQKLAGSSTGQAKKSIVSPTGKLETSAGKDQPNILSRKEMVQRNNLKIIGLGMDIFRETFRSYPPPRSAPGSRGLSWRVYLLNVLSDPLANLVDPNKNWSSTQNKKLIARMPETFGSSLNGEKGKTTYHVFVGRDAPFSDKYGPLPKDITDELSSTILVVVTGPEAAETWTKPGGLNFNRRNPKSVLGTLPEEGFMVLMFDGSVWRLPNSISNDALRALITHQGGEKIDLKAIPGTVLLAKGIASPSGPKSRPGFNKDNFKDNFEKK